MWLVTIFISVCIGSVVTEGSITSFISVRGGATPEVDTNEAFAEIGQYLLRIANKERYEANSKKKKGKAWKNAGAPYGSSNKLSAGQSALKSMDGATHRLRNTFSDKGATLEARFETFLDNDDAGSSKKRRKEAAKLYEYVSAVERFFQGSEILQAAVEQNTQKKKIMV